MGDRAVGVDGDPLLEQGVGLGPLQTALVDGGQAGQHANLEIVLTLFVLGELRGDALGFFEQGVGLGDAPFDKGEVGEQQVRFGVAGVLRDSAFEQRPGLRAVADDHEHLGEREVGGRQLRVFALGEIEVLAGAGNVVVDEAADRVVDLGVLTGWRARRRRRSVF